MTKQDLITAIVSGKFAFEELNDIYRSIRSARRKAAHGRAPLFTIGESVSFYCGGKLQTGTIVKINTATAVIQYGAVTTKASLISLREDLSELPSWLSLTAYKKDRKLWQTIWTMGANKKWKQSWQEFIAYQTKGKIRATVIRLLGIINFHTPLMESAYRQVVEWIEASPETRKYKFPLSTRQLNYLMYETDDLIVKKAEQKVSQMLSR